MDSKVLGIYGAGGLGREVLELARVINSRSNRWKEIIFIVDCVSSKQVNGVDVLEYKEAKSKYKDIEVIVGIGEPVIREEKYRQLELDGISVATLIHPDVYVPDTVKIGKGVVVQYGCFLACNIHIEDYVYLQPHCNISHDDILKEGSMLSGFANLGGNVEIGAYTYIGLSSAIKEKVKVGNTCIIGMGSIVFKDIEDNMVALGNPAKVIGRNIERRVFR